MLGLRQSECFRPNWSQHIHNTKRARWVVESTHHGQLLRLLRLFEKPKGEGGAGKGYWPPWPDRRHHRQDGRKPLVGRRGNSLQDVHKQRERNRRRVLLSIPPPYTNTIYLETPTGREGASTNTIINAFLPPKWQKQPRRHHHCRPHQTADPRSSGG